LQIAVELKEDVWFLQLALQQHCYAIDILKSVAYWQ